MTTSFTLADPICELAREECSMVPDVRTIWGQEPPNLTATSGSLFAGHTCRPAANIFQECNWWDYPDLLGVNFERMDAEDEDYPKSCGAGVLGSGLAVYQMSPACQSPCPAGFICPTERTTEPVPCTAGHYCPQGSSVAIPCATGTYSASTNISSAEECAICPIGTYCGSAAIAPVECAPGTYNNRVGQRVCTDCSAGKYMELSGATDCLRCGEGNYSSNVLSCLRARRAGRTRHARAHARGPVRARDTARPPPC